VGCPFCEGAAEQFYYMSDDRRYRLYLCDTCKRYIKTIDLRESGAEVCLPVENLITVPMDIAAREKGFLHC
jgi:FdhE protein